MHVLTWEGYSSWHVCLCVSNCNKFWSSFLQGSRSAAVLIAVIAAQWCLLLFFVRFSSLKWVVFLYAPKILHFTYEAIWQWKEHLLFCNFFVGIVVKPFCFREKAVRRRFRTVFLVICHACTYWDSLNLD